MPRSAGQQEPALDEHDVREGGQQITILTSTTTPMLCATPPRRDDAVAGAAAPPHSSATVLKNMARPSLSISSTVVTVSGATCPVSPIHVKNFLKVAR